MENNTGRFIHLKIWRQESRSQAGQFEEFKLPYKPKMNVISCLQEIQRNPVTADGKKTTPVIWDSNCLEEVCGSCTMRINGKVRMACSTLIDKLEQPITLQPLSKLPLDRDLAVDRDRMFEGLKQVKAWIQLDGTHNIGPAPRQSGAEQSVRYELSCCMTCACCVEACPQYLKGNRFIGAAAISQARLFNLHPSGAMNAADRLAGVMAEGGIQECGKAQVCVEACPKQIPLTTSISAMNRQVSKQILKDLFSKDDPSAHASSGPG